MVFGMTNRLPWEKSDPRSLWREWDRFGMTGTRPHSRELADDTITPRGIDATLMAAKVLALSAADLAYAPAALDEARNTLRRVVDQAQ
jgi:hypothetical protein